MMPAQPESRCVGVVEANAFLLLLSRPSGMTRLTIWTFVPEFSVMHVRPPPFPSPHTFFPGWESDSCRPYGFDGSRSGTASIEDGIGGIDVA